MKEMKKITRIGLFLLITAMSAVSALAVNLPGFKVTKGNSKTSQTFNVPSAGSLTVNVKVRVAGIFGVSLVGNSTYRAQLIRPNGDGVGEGVNVTAGGEFVTIRLETTVTCAQTGNWKVRVTNTNTVNPADGDVEFPPFNVPQLETHTTTLSAFTVNQGTSEDRSIASEFEPNAPGGRMTITATWDGICGFDTSGCKATLTLLRDGQPYGASSTGYSTNALFGNANPKAAINILVPLSDVSGNWSLRVKASSSGTISNVKPKVTFAERCN